MKWVGLLLFLSFAGCGLSSTVSPEVFRDLPTDKKMRLFDSENDVGLALDEQEQMRQRIRELKESQLEANVERDDAGSFDKGEYENKLTGRQAVAMWEARIDLLETSIDYLHARLDAQNSVVLVARAKFELAKALLMKKNKLQGAESLVVEDFETQVKSVTAQSKKQLEEVDKRKANLNKLRSTWLKLRDQVTSAHMSNLETPGEDEQPVWEIW